MEEKAILTAETLLKKKSIINDRKNAEYFSNVLDGIIKIERLSTQQVYEIMQNEDKTYFERQCELIYMSCSCFRDENLIKEYEAALPYEIVEKIFSSNLFEFAELTKEILNLYGFSNTGEAIKKQ